MIPELIRAPLRAIRHMPDRLRHTGRRGRALGTVAATDVRTALFICHGNINRSAYAAAAFSRALSQAARETVTVRSAGFIGPDRPASELAQSIAARRGLDLSEHRSRLIDPTELKETDLVVVMNVEQAREICRITGRPESDVVILGDLDPRPIDRRTIQDPYGHSQDVFERVFDRIDRCVEQLAGMVSTR